MFGMVACQRNQDPVPYRVRGQQQYDGHRHQHCHRLDTDWCTSILQQVPSSVQLICNSGITIGSLTAIVLNLILNGAKDTSTIKPREYL
jgi:hypothetical protein